MPSCHKIDISHLEVQDGTSNDLLRHIYNTIRQGRNGGKFTFKNLPKEIELMGEVNFSRWHNGNPPHMMLSAGAHLALVKAIIKESTLDNRLEIQKYFKDITQNALFHALAIHFDVGLQTLNGLQESAIGLYRVWRPSLHWPKHFVRGALQIDCNEQDCSIYTRETHRFKSYSLMSKDEHTFDGYLIRKSNQCFVLARDNREHTPQLTLLHAFLGSDQKIHAFEGVTICVYGHQIHTTSIYLERWNDSIDELLNALDIVDGTDVPSFIVSKLESLKP